MGKQLFIAEKPSVAQEFAKALGLRGGRQDGFQETDEYIITWCFGHLVTMSYPEAYDPSMKKWSYDTLPFLPETFKYDVIGSSAKQFKVVSGLLARQDVDRIYVCTDSGREGEYIYRLVEMMSPPSVRKKDRRRVWIDSFTEEEILRGIREAKPLSAYDHLAESAYLRAKEDYLMGINFSRVLSLRFGREIADYRGGKYAAVAVGRVMTCVLGMVVRREREIRNFVRQPFFRVSGSFEDVTADWKAVPGSRYENSPALYRDNGFRERKDAEDFISFLLGRENPQRREGAVPEYAAEDDLTAEVLGVSKKTEKKNPPLLYNLAELQNDCSRMFKISPDQTLKIAQELYEKKLTTYPRTDARVLSSAVAREIGKNISGLKGVDSAAAFAEEILSGNAYRSIEKTRYTDDKAITDHYAIIPTGSGLGALRSLSDLSRKVYDLIVRRFLSIFYPPAVYQKVQAEIIFKNEHFFASSRILKEPGYLRVAGIPSGASAEANAQENDSSGEQADALLSLRKGKKLLVRGFSIREGETKPPSRYTSGSMILAMENAGQLIEDESLREQIRGSGIGTSATRAEILAKLVRIGYLRLNKKTQVITPELLGEMVYDVVDHSIRPLLDAALTASWEKGLTGVADGTISTEEYMEKLGGFVARRTNAVKGLRNGTDLRRFYDEAAKYYKGNTGRNNRINSNKAERRPGSKEVRHGTGRTGKN
ncbi:MAG: type IA DNA topoisomerase [Lachnospiraceae bacterium]|nr:type IA DNA topoisomerase [Lachnospiraceae bacterium]